MESWINFPAVILITMLDLDMIKIKPRAVLWGKQYQSIIYAVSPIFLHYKHYTIKRINFIYASMININIRLPLALEFHLYSKI